MSRLLPVPNEREGGPVLGLREIRGGQPSVAYSYSEKIRGKVYNRLKLARLVGSSWVTETVEDGVVASWKALAFAPDGNPSIAYMVGDTLKFAHKTGSTWAIQSIETGALFISLAYDLAGQPTISHQTPMVGGLTSLRFVRWDGFQWVAEVVLTGVLLSYSSLAYDTAGIAAISYGVSTIPFCSNQLWIARRTGCSGTCWVNQLIEDFAPSGVNFCPSLAFGPTGAAAISFGWNGTTYPDRDLKFATQLP